MAFIRVVGAVDRSDVIGPHYRRKATDFSNFKADPGITPKGAIHVRHVKQPDGTIQTTVKLPAGVVSVNNRRYSQRKRWTVR